jgi:hypothetical protein
LPGFFFFEASLKTTILRVPLRIQSSNSSATEKKTKPKTKKQMLGMPASVITLRSSEDITLPGCHRIQVGALTA